MPSRLIIRKFKQTVHSIFKMEFRQEIQAGSKTLSVEVIQIDLLTAVIPFCLVFLVWQQSKELCKNVDCFCLSTQTVGYLMLWTPEVTQLGDNFEDGYFKGYISLEAFLFGG